MHKGIFITGTDTGVGKTFVTLGLLNAFKEEGLNVCAMKPLETGCRSRHGKLIPHDALRLMKESGTKEQLDIVNPYRFKLPLAPAVAAEIEGVKIDKRRILTAYKHLLSKYDITLVEGAGGIMVPVYKKYLFLDLIKDLNLPLIIVALPGIGTINHTLLTIEAARRRGISVIGVIINYHSRIKGDISVRTNPKAIESLGDISVLESIPYSDILTPQIKRIFSKIAVKILSLRQ